MANVTNEQFQAMMAELQALKAQVEASKSKESSRKKLTEDDEKAIEDYRSKVRHLAKSAGLEVAIRAAWMKFQVTGFERPRMDFTKEGRCHCIGFRVDGVTEVSEAEAKKAHLGFVRGYVDYTDPKFMETVSRMVGYIKANAK